MRKIIPIAIILLLNQISFAQTFCHHIDCGCIRIPDSIKSNLCLDTFINDSIITDIPDRFVPNIKNEDYKWQKNIRINKYSVNNETYLTDTIVIAEGFVLNGQRNDFWRKYYHEYHSINNPCYNTIQVGEIFYVDGFEMFELCRGYFRHDVIIDVDYDEVHAKFIYPIGLDLKDNSIDTILNLNIDCCLDSLEKIQCTATTDDSVHIFRVEGKYLYDEIDISRSVLKRKVLFGDKEK